MMYNFSLSVGKLGETALAPQSLSDGTTHGTYWNKPQDKL